MSPMAHGNESEKQSFTHEQVTTYLRTIDSMVGGRSIKKKERAMIIEKGIAAVRPILEELTSHDNFATISRAMLEDLVGASGKDAFNGDLPGNLMVYLVKNNLPYSQIITADFCVDDDQSKIPCDSGAPFNAGLLTTRMYLTGARSRFNLSRAIEVMENFACQSYPMDPDLQPSAPKEVLIDSFRAEKPSEQDMIVETSARMTNCYLCHGQFALHTQPFIRFDENGYYRTETNGMQTPDLSPGESKHGDRLFYSSHYALPGEVRYQALSEGGNVFGKDVANLREMGLAIASHEAFRTCSIKRALSFHLQIEPSKVELIPSRVFADIKNKIGAEDPTYQKIVLETFSHPEIIQIVIDSLYSEKKP